MTGITIDNTLISAVISAAVAVIVACGTVIWTTKSNRKLEEKKLNDSKKEELFYHNQTLMIIIADINAYNRKSSADILSLTNSLEPQKNETIRKIKLLTNMYFKNIDCEYDDVIKEIHIIFECIRINGNPGIEKFDSISGKLNSLSDKILSL